ncbi:DinB family protein [Pedobacter sp. JCM 36344]|uniref:DinB family protein n=1 Tax=Pedobacter sp. JCM 36344 TaxID=3374280 RepID=UPI00397A6751
MNRPQVDEYPAWGETYIKLVDGDVLEILERQITDFSDFISSLFDIADYAYAPGKWTIKELIGHIIDTERILIYRLTSFARGEQQALPGFEEDEYVARAHFSDRSLQSFSKEFELLRQANLYLIRSLNDKDLAASGTASGRQITVKAIVYILAGHIMHHTAIIKDRYLH